MIEIDDKPACGILLTRGYIALVDAADYGMLSKYRWCCKETRHQVYAIRASKHPDGSFRCLYMHQQILGDVGDKHVSRLNGNSLDYRRHNLLPVDRGKIQWTSISRHGASRFKGVSWHAGGQKWQAHIKTEGKLRYLGLFTEEIEAARAYDAAAIEHRSEFTRLNFPQERT